MTNRAENLEIIVGKSAEFRAGLVKTHVKEAEDLMDIAKALLNETLNILVPLFGNDGAADRLQNVVNELRENGHYFEVEEKIS